MMLAIPGSLLFAASVAAFGGGLPAPPAPAPPAGSHGPEALLGGRPLPVVLERQRRQELQDLQRQAVATALARHGVNVDWREHDLPELADWRERLEVASLLRTEQGLDVDWRTMTMADLNDLRLRAAKSTELAGLGVTVDWRRFSWRQLEEIRRAVAKIQASEVSAGADARTRQKGASSRAPTRAPAAGSVRNVPVITDI